MDRLSPEKRAALQALLASVPKEAAARVIEMFEKARVSEDRTLPVDEVMETLRASGIASESGAARKRTPERAFFDPFDSLFETPGPEGVLPGSISRTHLRPIWTWLRTAMPSAIVESCEDAIRMAAIRGFETEIDRNAEILRDHAVTVLMRLVDAEQRVFAIDSGLPEDAIVSVPILRDVLIAERAVRRELQALQFNAAELSDAQVNTLYAAYRTLLERGDDSARALLVLVMSRLSKPWQVFRLVRRIVPSSGDKILDVTDFAVFGRRILTEIERNVHPMLAAARGEDFATDALVRHIDRFNALVVGFAREFDCDAGGPWAKRLAELRRLGATALEKLAMRGVSLIETVLPVERSRVRRVGVIDHPRLKSLPTPEQLTSCAAHVRLLSATRLSATAAGFAAAREKAVREVAQHLAKFQEEVLDLVHEPETRPLAQLWVPVIGQITEAFDGPEAAQVFQRRARAA